MKPKWNDFFLSAIVASFLSIGHLTATESEVTLTDMYIHHWEVPCDINEHLPTLRKLASECSSVTEIGVRSIVSTWGILQGLSESSSFEKTYLGIDLAKPDLSNLNLAKSLAEDNGIDFDFWQINDMEIKKLEVTDMLFIDSLHTYCHLTYELEAFSPSVRKYLCFHDTSEPWGHQNEDVYKGDYSEYPIWIDRTKKGLWPAICDFLERHPEWTLQTRYLHNHGFTILKRIDEFVQY